MLERVWKKGNPITLLVGFAIPSTVALQAPLSMGFSRQEHWSVLPFPSLGDLPDPGIKPMSPTLAGVFFTTEPPGKPIWRVSMFYLSDWGDGGFINLGENHWWKRQSERSRNREEGSVFSTPSPAFIACRFLDRKHSDCCEVVPHCGFDLHFSNNEWCWASFHVFVSHPYVFFGEMSI